MQPGGRVYKAEAIVLRRISTGETDRVVTLFTREKGKLNAIAKGARGPRSRLAAATEPFSYLSAVLAMGQNLDVLTQAEVVRAFSGIRKDLVRVGYASYFVEVIDTGLEERQPTPELWDLLTAALSTLEEAETADVLARAFELHAMSLLGYEPRFHECVIDEAAVGGPGTGFHPLRGGLVCPMCARRVAGTVSLLPETLEAFFQMGSVPLQRLAHAKVSEAVRKELERCMVPYVRHHLSVELRTLEFLDDVTSP